MVKTSSIVCIVCLCHLLAVEEDDKLDGVDERQQRAKESSCPNHSLTINKPEHVGGNYELLTTHPLSQLTGPVVHHHPETQTHKKTTHSHG